MSFLGICLMFLPTGTVLAPAMGSQLEPAPRWSEKRRGGLGCFWVPIGMLLYGISISILSLLYYCNRGIYRLRPRFAEQIEVRWAILVKVAVMIVGVL